MLVDTMGTVFLSGDVLLLTVNAIGSVTGVGQIGEIILNKMTP